MFYKDDWLSWTYDGVKFGNKITPQSVFEFQIKKASSRPLKTHKEELLENTCAMRDRFSEPFDLLFSGGLDSEVILRCHVELHIPINVFIFKYNNDYNIHDVRHALRICDELNVTPTVIDFDLDRFFENDAYDIWKQTYTRQAGRLPHMKMVEYLDNIPVMGDGCPYWIYYADQWLFEIDEVDHSQSIYAVAKNRPMLADWYEYSPEVILSHLELPRIQRLLNAKEVPDKSAFEITKYFTYKTLWPAMEVRPKRNGFEGASNLSRINSIESLKEFQKVIDAVDITHTSNRYTQEEIITLLG